MGTNYYAEFHISHWGESVIQHLGKHSGGWKFQFHNIPGGRSFKQLKETLKNATEITNEYGDVITYDDFIKTVLDTKDDHFEESEITENSDCAYLDDDHWPFYSYEFG